MEKRRNVREPQASRDARVTPNADPDETLLHSQVRRAAGAVPPTGGAPPEDAQPAGGHAPEERPTADDLVEVFDLVLRAARKGLGGVDAEVEAAAERALLKLQQLDETRVEVLDPAGGTQGELEKVTRDVGRELAALVERLAERVDAALPLQGER